MPNASEFYCPDCDNGLDVRAPRSRRQTRREFLGTAVASWHDYAPGVSDRTRRQARDYYRRATRPHRHEIYGPGTFIVADGKMLLLTTNGWLSVVEVSARGHKTLASAQVITGRPGGQGLRTWTARLNRANDPRVARRPHLPA